MGGVSHLHGGDSLSLADPLQEEQDRVLLRGDFVQLLVDEVLDLLEELDVVLRHHADRAPGAPGARRSADAVHVVLRVHGDVVVQHQVHAGNKGRVCVSVCMCVL